MFTPTEIKYLALTFLFLATGTGIKAYRHSQVQIGPVEDPAFDSPLPDSLVPAAAEVKPYGVDSSGGDSTSRAHPPSHPVVESTHKAAFSGKVSLNHASPTELTAIRGIGAKTAQVIVQYRKDHGPFRDLQELLQVKGIGEKKLEKILPFLIL